MQKDIKGSRSKLHPGMIFSLFRALRKEFPGLLLQVDANSAYTLNDIALFKKMDEYNLSADRATPWIRRYF